MSSIEYRCVLLFCVRNLKTASEDVDYKQNRRDSLDKEFKIKEKARIMTFPLNLKVRGVQTVFVSLR